MSRDDNKKEMIPIIGRVPVREVLRRLKWFGRAIDSTTRFISPSDDQQDAMGSPIGIASGIIRFGMWMLVVVFGVFGLWAITAPLDSAAVCQGQVVVDSNKKTIQHLEGGIVDAILVKEGEKVKEGQPLIRLNPTASNARLGSLQSQYYTYKTTATRLMAERDGKSEIQFPADILKAAETKDDVKEVLESQKRLFASRKASLKDQVDILHQKIEQQRHEIEGLDAQQKSAGNQIDLLNQEIATVQKLLDSGNAMKPRLLALQRSAADLEGKRGENLAMISRTKQSIAEAELSIIAAKNDYLNKVNQELKDTQLQVSDLEEKLRASQDIVDRIIIAAPLSGTVTDLKIHTVGGVVTPGEKIMDIVPSNEKLIVEARVLPTDIDVVRAGLPARIRLTAYKTRTTPQIDGKVVVVSADRFEDQRSGASYYLARVEVDEDEVKKLKHVELSQGMPADVLIITGERTLFRYFATPITDSLNQAFREQ